MRTRLTLLMVLAFVLVVAFALTFAPDEGAATGTALGVDVQTTGNSATGLGPIETCRRVEVGQSFDIDVWIRDVTGLHGWELVLAFDKARLSLTQVEFLFATQFALNDSVSNGQFLAAGSLAGASGTGVLARVTFQATAAGSTPLNLVNSHINPGGAQEIPIDSVTPGAIAIGQNCGAATPTPTVATSPTAAPTPTATAAPSPTGTPVPDRVDVNCDQRLDTGDALRVLEHEAGVAQALPGCPAVATPLGGAVFGDLDCNGLVEPLDVLALFLYLSGVETDPPVPC